MLQPLSGHPIALVQNSHRIRGVGILPCRRFTTLKAVGRSQAFNFPVIQQQSTVQQQQPPTTQSVGGIRCLLVKGVQAAALGFALLLMVTAFPGEALAARSGGRAGGSAFGSRGLSGMHSSSGFGGAQTSYGSSFGGYSDSISQPRSSVHLHVGGPSMGWGWGPSWGYGAPVVSTGPPVLVYFAIALVALYIITSMRRDTANTGDELGGAYQGDATIVKVQIGLMSVAKDAQSRIRRAAEFSDTSSRVGLGQLLEDVSVSLGRSSQYWSHGQTWVKHFNNIEKAESDFKKESVTERTKFSMETFSNVGGSLKRQASLAKDAMPNETVVVTIIAAISGKIDIGGKNQKIQETLSTLATIPSSQVEGVEIIWTPDEEGDYITSSDMLMLYPALSQI